MPLYRSLAPSRRAPRSTSSPNPDPPPRAVRRISTTFPTTFGRSYRTRESGARRRTIRPRGGVDAVRDPRLHGLPANRQQNGRRAPNRFARVCLSSLLPILRDSAYILLLCRGRPPLPSLVARRSPPTDAALSLFLSLPLLVAPATLLCTPPVALRRSFVLTPFLSFSLSIAADISSYSPTRLRRHIFHRSSLSFSYLSLSLSFFLLICSLP